MSSARTSGLLVTELHEGWTVRAVGDLPHVGAAHVAEDPLPAAVPGSVHLDLLAAGVIEDPYLDQNEAVVAWVGQTDWCFETTFTWPGADGAAVTELVAEGLDTLATVELNDHLLGRTANQHRSHTFDVTSLLREGDNRLTITFAAAEPAAYAIDAADHRPYVGIHPFNALRKMASSYGWDWGPVLVSAGIDKPIRLLSWSTARIASVRPLVDVEPDGTGVLTTHVDVRRAPGADDEELRVAVQVAGVRTEGVVAAGSTTATVEVRVPEVERWWPRGHGDQPLYAVDVTLAAADGQVLDGRSTRVGFRTVALDTAPDEEGTPFRIVVNGQPVFARGLNWIPEDCFPVRVDAARYGRRLDQAVGMGANLIRVWGGGLYESDAFYDACDERGLLVWQDFLFACAAYSEERLGAEVEAEAREAVTRLSPHPSLVLWNGNNENIWGHVDWDWEDGPGGLHGASWGWGFYTDLLPRVVAELDPSRPYCPGTPYAMDPDRYPNDDAHGPTHLWEQWNRRDYLTYREHRPRFVAEFGWQGPPTWATLMRSVHDEPLTPTSLGVLAHQKAEDGQGKLARGLERHLPEPQTFADWHWATSLTQARAVRLGVEHLRSLAPSCSGAVVWQLNDCWPVTSWAAVDGDGRRKPLWYALRRAFADRLASVQPRGAAFVLALHEDGGERWAGAARVRRVHVDGTVLAEAELAFDVPARGSLLLDLPDDVVVPQDPASEVLVADVGGGLERAWWSYAEDRDSDLPEPGLEADVAVTQDGYRVQVRATTFVKDLALLADRLAPDAEVDQMLLTLLPGETAELAVTTRAALDPAALVGPEVLRSANQLVVGARVVA